MTIVLGIVDLGLLAWLFRDSIAATLDVWLTSPEYNFGPLVPVIVALMLSRGLDRSQTDMRGGWFGVVLVWIGVALGIVESLSQTRFPGQVGLFVVLIGLFIAWQGEGRARDCWPGLAFFLFGLPLANGIQVILTSALQLVSSVGAVVLIRAADIPVLREGNIIDLGAIQLQVAEACSGLRYLFPLGAFSFLCAYLFAGSWLQRTLIFLSAIPITIAMNIFRIGITGLLVDRFGVAAAQGFFHDFEGWIVYCACLVVLFGEMKLLCYAGSGFRSLLQRLDLEMPRRAIWRSDGEGKTRTPVPLLASGVVVVAAIILTILSGNRTEWVPARAAFAIFPREIGAWQATDAPVDAESLAALDADDHLSLNFLRSDGRIVNLWGAYYQSQFSGSAAHSPLVCIPGGGWEIESAERSTLSFDATGAPAELPVNRLVIVQGSTRQLVYYWFVEGGVVEANEYRAKVRLLANSIIRNRRDGALVRFITPIEGGDEEAADSALRQFITETAPLLPQYLPGAT